MVINTAVGEIVKLFVADPTQTYNIREVAKKTGVNYRLVYNAVLVLEKEKFLEIKNIGNIRLCSFHAGGNLCLAVYGEAERTRAFLEKSNALAIIAQEIEKKMSTVYDTILIFGSYAKGNPKPSSDIDILCIIPEEVKYYEQNLHVVLKLLNYKIDLNILTEKEFVSAKKEESMNIAKEVIPNHIILRGAEQFHALLAK